MQKLAWNAELAGFSDVVQDMASVMAIATCPDIQVCVDVEAFEQ